MFSLLAWQRASNLRKGRGVEVSAKKERILVMNGQRLLQQEQGLEWTTKKVSKAGRLKPGIYNAYLAKDADPTLQHNGIVFHANGIYVYQQIGQNIVRHSSQAFDSVPEYGKPVSISYQQGKALVVDTALSQGRKLSR
ncbi:cell filamentation protein [Nitrosospira multiformis]|uniref:Cell filamentation protein n=1 Tax=Nitrosospira multiformis TaxID=1231 RepID=A0A1I7I4E7_9PROT|nr:cell filamentation protein [Nitrosospira multiformis]